MRLYHFVGEKYGLDNVLRRRLKIARIDDLNDPFEFMARAAGERERAALRATKMEQSKRLDCCVLAGVGETHFNGVTMQNVIVVSVWALILTTPKSNR